MLAGYAGAGFGSAVGAWVDWTPTGSWVTNVDSYDGKYRQVGKLLEGWARVKLSGAPDATELLIDLPPGFTSAEFIPSGSGEAFVGVATVYDSTSAKRYEHLCVMSNAGGGTQFRFMPLAPNGVDIEQELGGITNLTPIIFAASDQVWFSFRIPLA